MEEIGRIVLINTKPGKRDDVMKMWKEYALPMTKDCKGIKESIICKDIIDPNLICIFELFTDKSFLEDSINSKWLEENKDELSRVLAVPPVIMILKPAWIKRIRN